MNSSTPLPRVLMLAISLTQGLALFLLYQAADSNSWPSNQPLWDFPLWTATVCVPLLILLTITTQNIRRTLWFTALFSAALILCATYTGWITTPAKEVRASTITLIFILTMGLAVFKGLMYIQQRCNNQPLTYPLLFTYSWRNFLSAALAMLFVGGVALILLLWGQLFSAIGISFFADLFSKSAFLFPVLSVAFGFGLIIFRNLDRIIDNITGLLEGLIRLLLPLVVVVAMLFFVTLPFVGLQPLWDTGNGTALLLWLTAAMLFFINAVYQTGDEPVAYPGWVKVLIAIGVCTLPIFSAVSFYGLWLRISDYGWTVERCWAMLVWAVLAAFSLGYAYGVLRRRSLWPRLLAQTNIYMGWIILALMLLINSPLLDFRKIALSSQVQRVHQDGLSWHEFDFYYVHRNLGRPGFLLMQDLLEKYPDDDKLKSLIENPQHPSVAGRQIRRLTLSDLSYRGAAFEIPEPVASFLNQHAIRVQDGTALIMKVDLNRDQIDDYVLLQHSHGYIHPAYVIHGTGSTSENWSIHQLAPDKHHGQDLGETFIKGQIQVRAPAFDELTIGDITFRVISTPLEINMPQPVMLINPSGQAMPLPESGSKEPGMTQPEQNAGKVSQPH